MEIPTSILNAHFDHRSSLKKKLKSKAKALALGLGLNFLELRNPEPAGAVTAETLAAPAHISDSSDTEDAASGES
jgi:hypothetical protein